LADVIDRAQALTDFYLRQQIVGTGSDSAAASETHCKECGEPIPEKRREAAPGCRFCVPCQMEMESRQ